ncbi:MAG TPA: hypothetical protein VI455_16690 [Terriglobia bacterium]
MKQRAYLYFVSTFLLGVVVGAVGLFLYAWYGGHWHRPMDRGRIVRDLGRELKLNDQQTTQLTQIMNDSAKKYDQLHNQVRPQFEALRDATDDQIRQILTPDQVTKFNELVRKWRAGARLGPGPRR